MRVHIFSIVWNEEFILPFFFKHYRERFKDVQFTIYDNMSTDNTRNIILEHGAELLCYDTKDEIRGDLQIQLKNNCWKTSDADWVIVCDADEWIDCNDEFLEKTDCTIVKPEGYNMVGYTLNLDRVTRGARNTYFDKCILFKRSAIREINYGPGCHKCRPQGDIVYNKERILLYHMKYFHLRYFSKRSRQMLKRISQVNKENNWSVHYVRDARYHIVYYARLWLKSKKVRKKKVG